MGSWWGMYVVPYLIGSVWLCHRGQFFRLLDGQKGKGRLHLLIEYFWHSMTPSVAVEDDRGFPLTMGLV